MMMFVEVTFWTWKFPILTPLELQLSLMGQPDENPNGNGKVLEKLLVTQEPWHLLFSELTDFAWKTTKRTVIVIVIVIEKDNFAWYNIILDSPIRKQSNHQLPPDKKKTELD